MNWLLSNLLSIAASSERTIGNIADYEGISQMAKQQLKLSASSSASLRETSLTYQSQSLSPAAEPQIRRSYLEIGHST